MIFEQIEVTAQRIDQIWHEHHDFFEVIVCIYELLRSFCVLSDYTRIKVDYQTYRDIHVPNRHDLAID